MIVFYFLIFVMPLAKHRFWGALAGDFTGIKYIGMVCLPYALFELARGGKMPSFFSTWQARLFILLYLIASFSFLFTGRVAWNFSHWLSYSSFLIFAFITVVLVNSRRRLRWVVLAGVGAIGLASAYVVRDWQLFHNVYSDYRPGWIVGDPNYFTVDALIFMPVALLLLQQRRPRWQALFCFGCLAMTIVAVLFSASRGGFVGLVAGCIFFLLKSRHRLRNLLFVCATIAVMSLPMEISPVARLLHPTRSDAEAQQTRLALWSGGLRMIQQHPIFGVGLDNYRFEVAKYIHADEIPQYETVERVAHNSYMEIAAEMGVPTLLIFIGIVLSSILSLSRVERLARKSGDDFMQRVSLGLQAGILGGAVALFFVSGEYQKLFWLAISISACLPPLVAMEHETITSVSVSPSRKVSKVDYPWPLPSEVNPARIRGAAGDLGPTAILEQARQETEKIG